MYKFWGWNVHSPILKVKPGAVDIVRHWQELGYLLVYVTGRPDMQLQRVVAWLTQHNFPKGLVSFADGFTTDPLKYAMFYFFLWHLIFLKNYCIHFLGFFENGTGIACDFKDLWPGLHNTISLKTLCQILLGLHSP